MAYNIVFLTRGASKNIHVRPDRSIWKFVVLSGQEACPDAMAQNGQAAYQPLRLNETHRYASQAALILFCMEFLT